MPANRPIRHHYVPVFYLKRWLCGGKQLVEFSRPYGAQVKPRRVHPAGTGYVDRLYELRGLPEELAQQVEEKVFHPVDTRAADVMEALHAGDGPRDARDRLAWTQFLVSMLIRNPEELRRMKAVYAEHWARSDKKWERRGRKERRPGDPETFAEHLAATPASWVELNAMKAFVSSLSAKNTTSHIFRMKWGHLHMPFWAPALMTSDRPIVSEGLAKDDGHIVLPIGPKRLFYAVNRHSTADYMASLAPHELVRRVNVAVTVHAHKYVYATTDSVLPFVQKHMSADPALLMSDGFKKYPGGQRIKARHIKYAEQLLQEH